MRRTPPISPLPLRANRIPCALILVLTACVTLPGPDPSQELPGNWETMGSEEFAFLHDSLAAPRWTVIAQEDLRTKSLGFGENALRATLLLNQLAGTQVNEHFVASLERRVTPPNRGEAGNQITQAAALMLRPTPMDQNQQARLLALVKGPSPHPDLAVRVECACTLLGLQMVQVAPFLIRVLRARTPAESSDPPDWPRLDTMAWVKHRSAQALAQHLGVPNTFRPDGSWQHQIDQAREWEQQLQ